MKKRLIPVYIATILFFALVCSSVAVLLVCGVQEEMLIWLVPVYAVICLIWTVVWLLVFKRTIKQFSSAIDSILKVFSNEDTEALMQLNGGDPTPEQVSSWICDQEKIADRIRFNNSALSASAEMSREIFWQISDNGCLINYGNYWTNIYGYNAAPDKNIDIRQLLSVPTQVDFNRALKRVSEKVGTDFRIAGSLQLPSSKSVQVEIYGRSTQIDGSSKTMVLGTVYDMQVQADLILQLEREKTKTAFLLNSTYDVIYEADVVQNRLKSLNPRASKETFGIEDMQDFDGERRPYWDLIHPDYREGFVDRFFNYNHMLAMPEHKMRFEYKVKNRFGDYIWVEHTAQVISIENGDVTKVIGRIRNINNSKSDEFKSMYKSSFDSLTGAMLGSAVAEKYEDVSYSSDPHCIVLFNINRFRYINNEYGYETGNKVLLYMVTVLWEKQKGRCIVGRLSDDCFIVAMIEADGERTPQAQVKKVFEMFNAPVKIGNRMINITLSASCSEIFENPVFSYDEAFRQAKFAMNVCKHENKSYSNSFVEYSNELRNRFPQLVSDDD